VSLQVAAGTVRKAMKRSAGKSAVLELPQLMTPKGATLRLAGGPQQAPTHNTTEQLLMEAATRALGGQHLSRGAQFASLEQLLAWLLSTEKLSKVDGERKQAAAGAVLEALAGSQPFKAIIMKAYGCSLVERWAAVELLHLCSPHLRERLRALM
jgi:hypothetical protein